MPGRRGGLDRPQFSSSLAAIRRRRPRLPRSSPALPSRPSGRRSVRQPAGRPRSPTSPIASVWRSSSSMAMSRPRTCWPSAASGSFAPSDWAMPADVRGDGAIIWPRPRRWDAAPDAVLDRCPGAAGQPEGRGRSMRRGPPATIPPHPRLILAGGLTPENVAERLRVGPSMDGRCGQRCRVLPRSEGSGEGGRRFVHAVRSARPDASVPSTPDPVMRPRLRTAPVSREVDNRSVRR